MKKSKLFFISTAIAVLAASSTALSASADSPISPGGSDYRLYGEVTPTVITATLPTELKFTIDPNAQDEAFSCATGILSNETPAPINVTVLSIKSMPECSVKVVNSDAVEDWDNLGTQDTQSMIALGIQFFESQEEPSWAPAETSSNSNGFCNVNVGPNATENYTMVGKCGRAWDTVPTLEYRYCVKVSLAK